MTVEIRWTEERSYIRIVDPGDAAQNWGYISPRNGQLSARPVLYDMINSSAHGRDLAWQLGPGQHGGVKDYHHTDVFQSPDETVGFVAQVLGANGIAVLDLRLQ